MLRTFVSLFLALALFVGCRKDNDPVKSRAGYFLLTEIKNPELKNAGHFSADSGKASFFLGDLKASREFYFLLSNGGDNPIFNVHLETDHSQFTIAPKNISKIEGKDSSEGASFIPLLSLDIIHGTRLNGVGHTTLLPMDENTATLTITGQTMDNGDTIDLRSDFDFSVYAKQMDIRLFENGLEVDLSKPTGTAMFGINFGGLGPLRYYHFISNTFTIQNTGNVDISIRVTEYDDQGNFLEPRDMTLPQNQSLDIEVSQVHVVLSLDSDGTITDDSRIQLGNDGKGYFAVLIYNE